MKKLYYLEYAQSLMIAYSLFIALSMCFQLQNIC